MIWEELSTSISEWLLCKQFESMSNDEHSRLIYLTDSEKNKKNVMMKSNNERQICFKETDCGGNPEVTDWLIDWLILLNTLAA